jgi:hypothetical protein
MATNSRTKDAGKGETSVAQRPSAVMTERPAYLQKGGNQGRENITAEDTLLPRLEIVQSLSPALDETKPEYIDGAKAGDLVNSVTHQIYDKPVLFVPVMFIKQFNIWKLRLAGGGFMGSYPTKAEAQAELNERVPVNDQHQYEILDTPVFYGLVVLETEEGVALQRISISMPKTKAKHARRLNSLIDLSGENSYHRVYGIGTVTDKSPKGEFKNFTIEQMGYPNELVVTEAEAFYKVVKSGAVNVRVDQSSAGITEDSDEM